MSLEYQQESRFVSERVKFTSRLTFVQFELFDGYVIAMFGNILSSTVNVCESIFAFAVQFVPPVVFKIYS